MDTLLYFVLLQSTLFIIPSTDACNLAIIATSEASNLTSPGYPTDYPSNADCWWTIKSLSADKRIGVKVVDLNVESETHCSYDSLSFYDGDDSSSPLLARMCGSHKWSVISTGNSMFIRFRSDDSRSDPGFFLMVFEVGKCGGELTATSDINSFTSPGYPITYFNNMSCTWIITAENENDTILITTKDLNVQSRSLFSFYCTQDAVSFDTGNTTEDNVFLGSFCGMAQPILQSSNNVMRVHFVTDGSGTSSGFDLSYSTKSAGDCNITTVVSTLTTFLLSPGFPEAYYNDLDCNIDIISTTGYVELHILTLDIEGSYPDCDNDSLSVYSGLGAEDEMTTLCGNTTMVPPVIVSNTSLMSLRFKTNSDIVGKGYSVSVKGTNRPVVPTIAPDCGSRYLTANSTPQYLQTPGYPQHYYNNERCVWTMTASHPDMMVRIVIIDAAFEMSYTSTDCDYDYVMVYDGSSSYGFQIAKWCDMRQPIIQSSGQSMTLKFHTDGSNTQRGFKLKYFETSVVPITPTYCGSRYLTANSTPQYLQSPGYPQHYYNNELCVWTMTASQPDMMVRIVIIDADFETSSTPCDYDYVTVYDGSSSYGSQIARWCNKRQPVIQSSGQSMTLTFNTDSSNTQRGFKLKYSETSEQYICGRTINATLSPQHLTSPNYPGNYNSNQDCRWTIFSPDGENIKISTTNIHIESSSTCAFDYLQIYDGTESTSIGVGKLCGSVESTFISSGSSVTVIFHTDNSNSYSGFDYKVQAQHYGVCEGGTVNLYTSYLTKDLLSPNYPFEYPSNVDCTWLIDSGGSDYIVKVDVVTSHLEYSAGCTNDYVEAYDGQDGSSSSLGRWCGTDVPIKRSTGRYMFLKFKSDNSVTRSGFKIHYTQEFEFSSDYGYVNAGAVVGGIIGGIVLLIIVVVVISSISSRRQRPVVTRVPDTGLYTVSTGALETTVTPAAPATFTPPPSYTAATVGAGTSGGPPPYSVAYTNRM